MNKIITTGFALLLIASANVASAEMTMTPSQHPVYSDPAKNGGKVTIIGYISNIEWDKNMAEAATREGKKLPVVAPEATVTDEGGIKYSCSNTGVSRHSCVSLVNTKEYRDNMLSIARSIIAGKVESAFPSFAGWIKLAK